jgi:citrate lyase subunit beta/citryl-CoA lyase
MSPMMKPLRSMLFVPGHKSEMVQKATDLEADALILDLEDAVPISKKAEARELLCELLETGMFEDITTYCRINGIETKYILEDIRKVISPSLDGIVYPNSSSGEDVRFIQRYLGILEEELGLKKHEIVPLIETPRGVMNSAEICSASDRITAVAFGSEDFVAEIEAKKPVDEQSLHIPRSLIAMSARANDVIPIDTVYTDIKDIEGFKNSIQTGQKYGFEGALVLHPEQIPVANEVFKPTKEEIEQAKKIVSVADNDTEYGVTTVDDEFIGPPIVKAARKTLERVERIDNV